MKWQKINSKKIFEHPKITLLEDIVKLPSGTKTEYLRFASTHDSSMIIPIDNDQKILVQKEYSYPPNEIMYQFPGGGIDDNESPEQGALRELSEEANLSGTLKYIGYFYVDNRRTDKKQHVFVATKLEKKIGTKDAEEDFEDYWFTKEEINALIKNGEITNYSMLAGWALFCNAYFSSLSLPSS